MRHAPTVARILLGLVFTIFGLNGFFHFMPNPPQPPAAGQFLGAMAATGYFFALLSLTQTVSGLLLLAGRLVPLALTLLAPVLVNILAFHVFLAPGGLLIPVVLTALEIYLAWAYRAHFVPMLQADARPAAEVVPARPLAR